jgi:hypothetical protein
MVGGIHAAGPEVADLLADAACGGVVGAAFSLMVSGVDRCLPAPGCRCPNSLSAAGMVVAFDPAAVGILKEVGGRADGCVEILAPGNREGLFFLVVAGSQGEEEYCAKRR